MTNTHYKWEATFKSALPIKQFEKGVETPFSVIEQNKDDLKTFKIVADDGEFYEVDIIKGEINCNGKKNEKLELMKNEVPDLIYSRRNQVRLNIVTGEQLSKRTTHMLGLKTNTEKIVIEAFPGLGIKEKKIKLKTEDTEKDITGEMK